MIDLSTIETEINFKSPEDKVRSIAYRAVKRGIKVYIAEADFKEFQRELTCTTNHKLYQPKYYAEGMPLRKWLKAKGLSEIEKLVVQRIRNGWSLEDAISIPKGDRTKRRKRKMAEYRSKHAVTYAGVKASHIASTSGGGKRAIVSLKNISNFWNDDPAEEVGAKESAEGV